MTSFIYFIAFYIFTSFGTCFGKWAEYENSFVSLDVLLTLTISYLTITISINIVVKYKSFFNSSRNKFQTFTRITFVLMIKIDASLGEEEKECGEKIYSSPTEKRGVLSSINHPNHYPENVKCLYFLIGLPNERVEIVFTQFEVMGVPPR